MSFTVRQLSRTADGREIVRSSSFDGDSITIGRDPGSSIVLSDLAVDMNHARMVAASRGRIVVESVGGLEFTYNRQGVTQCEIDIHEGATLGFGSHKLTIGADSGSTIVTVERMAADNDVEDERQFFQLTGLLPSRRSFAWTFVIAVLAMFLIWPIWTYSNTPDTKQRTAGFHADTTWESGPLSLAHHSLEQNCQACHVNKFEPVQDKACLDCHKDDAHDHAPMKRLVASRGEKDFGGSIKQFVKDQVGKPQGQCVECHTEHEGSGKMPRTAQAFCTDCHATLQKQLPDTKLADASDFGTGHPQFMVNLTINPGQTPRQFRRVALDGSSFEDNGLKFPHDIHLSKTNSIARMTRTLASEQGWGTSLECKDCHVVTPDGVRFKPMTMEANCQACHSLSFDQVGGTVRTLRHGEPEQVMADLRGFYRSTLPPRPVNLSGMARRQPGEYAAEQATLTYLTGAKQWPNSAERAIESVFSKGGACYDCHIINRVAGSFKVTKVFQPKRYLENGWFDHKAHDTEKCESCHKAGTSKRATDVLLPDLASCRTCHVGESGAKKTKVDKPVRSGCAMCHDYHISPAAGAPWRSDGERKKVVGKIADVR